MRKELNEANWYWFLPIIGIWWLDTIVIWALESDIIKSRMNRLLIWIFIYCIPQSVSLYTLTTILSK